METFIEKSNPIAHEFPPLSNSYKVYMIVSIQSDLKKDVPDFSSINNIFGIIILI